MWFHVWTVSIDVQAFRIVAKHMLGADAPPGFSYQPLIFAPRPDSEDRGTMKHAGRWLTGQLYGSAWQPESSVGFQNLKLHMYLFSI